MGKNSLISSLLNSGRVTISSCTGVKTTLVLSCREEIFSILRSVKSNDWLENLFCWFFLSSSPKSNNINWPDISVIQSCPAVIFCDSPNTVKATSSDWYPLGSFSFSTLKTCPITIPPIPSILALNFIGITADSLEGIIGFGSPVVSSLLSKVVICFCIPDAKLVASEKDLSSILVESS